MARVYCPLFDNDLHKRKSTKPLCRVHEVDKKRCTFCQMDRRKAITLARIQGS